MKVIYRGFEIEAKREQAMGGWKNLYFTVFRQSDGWCMIDDFTTGDDSARSMIGYLKANVDDYHENPRDWDDPQLEDDEDE